MKTVAYLGQKNRETYTKQAAKQLFPDDKLIPYNLIGKVIYAVENQEANLGIVPIDNIYDGDIEETLDTLTECKRTNIIQEKAIKINHTLGALIKDTKITNILSKDTALRQCRKYLLKHYPNAHLMPASNTAEAVTKVLQKDSINYAAIAPEEEIKSSKLEILATSEQLCPNNKTRFIVLSHEKTEPSNNDKTLLAIHPQVDQPGTLLSILRPLTELKINLELIQSRPDGEAGYRFYLELTGHQQDVKVKAALREIEYNLNPNNKYKNIIKILGSYKNTNWKK